MSPQKLQAGSILPTISLPKAGDGDLQIGGAGRVEDAGRLPW